jgi:hypothetical protein
MEEVLKSFIMTLEDHKTFDIAINVASVILGIFIAILFSGKKN